WSTISKTASASHSGGTSRPSLNWRGSSTSNRRQLLLIGGFSLDFKWDVLVGERFQSRFGNQMLARTKDPAGKTSEQKGQCPLFRLAVRECNRHHGSHPY